MPLCSATRAREPSEMPPHGIAPRSPAYEAGASLFMLRGQKVRQGVAPCCPRLQLGASLSGSRTGSLQPDGGGLAPHAGQGTTRFPGAAGASAGSPSRSERWGSHPRPSRPKRDALLTELRPDTDDGGLAPHPPRGGARLSRAARRTRPVHRPGTTPRPGLAPGSFRLTGGRSALELARNESPWPDLHRQPLRSGRSAHPAELHSEDKRTDRGDRSRTCSLCVPNAALHS